LNLQQLSTMTLICLLVQIFSGCQSHSEIQLADSSALRILVSTSTIRAETPVTLECIVQTGAYDDWEYEWSMPAQTYDIGLYQGARITWIPPFGRSEQILGVTVSNDTVSYVEEILVFVNQPGIPKFHIEPNMEFILPAEATQFTAVSDDSISFPLDYNWSVSQGHLSNTGNEQIIFTPLRSGDIRMILTASNGHYSNSDTLYCAVQNVAPEIQDFITDQDSWDDLNQFMHFYIFGFDLNHDALDYTILINGELVESGIFPPAEQFQIVYDYHPESLSEELNYLVSITDGIETTTRSQTIFFR
jgi:hypothetical protein